MFKSWQIFVASLVPLALVFTGVIIGSVHGVDSEKEVFPTPPPRPAASAPLSSNPSTPGGTTLQLRALNLAYDKRTLTAPANTAITVQLDNADAGVLHNVSFYTNNRATTALSTGELKAGPIVVESKFTTPAAGTYFYRCDAHTDMTGTFTVR